MTAEHPASRYIFIMMRRAVAVWALCLLPCAAAVAGCSTAVCTPTTEADLAELAEREEVGCYVKIYDTDLRSLEALQGLTKAHYVGVSNNPELANIDALSSLADVGGLSISSNSSLTQVALRLEAEIGALSFRGASLERIDLTLAGEREAQFNVVDAPALRGLEVHVGHALEVQLQRVENLDSLEGLSDIRKVTGLYLRDLPKITQAQVDAFIAQLDEPPEGEVCGLMDSPPCP